MSKIYPGMSVRKESIFVNGIEHRHCSVCKGLLSIDKFGQNKAARNGRGLNYACKECHNKRRRDRYKENPEYKSHANQYAMERVKKNKREAIAYKGGKCLDCPLENIPGQNDFLFDFHHRDPSKKDFAISQYKSRTLESLKSELDKCDLLCSNCHRVRHQREWQETGRIQRGIKLFEIKFD